MEIATRMIKAGFTDEVITQMIDLSVEQIEFLRKQE